VLQQLSEQKPHILYITTHIGTDINYDDDDEKKRKEKVFMHQKKYPLREKTKNRIGQTPKTEEDERNTCLERATRSCSDEKRERDRKLFEKR